MTTFSQLLNQSVSRTARRISARPVLSKTQIYLELSLMILGTVAMSITIVILYRVKVKSQRNAEKLYVHRSLMISLILANLVYMADVFFAKRNNYRGIMIVIFHCVLDDQVKANLKSKFKQRRRLKNKEMVVQGNVHIQCEEKEQENDGKNIEGNDVHIHCEEKEKENDERSKEGNAHIPFEEKEDGILGRNNEGQHPKNKNIEESKKDENIEEKQRFGLSLVQLQKERKRAFLR
ncbi:hypothetical protein AC249_AIPGENE10796 [Exaiptasia diaphana]|nr:hypothetical protein AC249_AIPGENE10796 [Exaiptasia diaphana]